MEQDKQLAISSRQIVDKLMALINNKQVPHDKYYISVINNNICIFHPYDSYWLEVDRSLSGRRFDWEKKYWFTNIKHFCDVVDKYAGSKFYFEQNFFEAVTKWLDAANTIDYDNVQKISDRLHNSFEHVSNIVEPPTPDNYSLTEKFKQMPDYEIDVPLTADHIKPYLHQRIGIGFLLENQIGILGDEMGLGKSMQAIIACYGLLAQKKIKHVLVVCPNPLKLNWLNEIKKFTGLDEDQTLIMQGNKAQRQRLLSDIKPWIIINYELMRIEVDSIKTLLKDHKFAMVCDESHKIKSPKAQQSEAIAVVGKMAVRKYLLTGTLVANRPEDVWNQIRFLDQGMRLGQWTEFRKTYCIEREMKVGRRRFNKIVGYKNLPRLQKAIDSVMLRRTKEQCLDLPEKIFQILPAQLSPKQEAYYRQVALGIIDDIQTESGPNIELNDVLTKMLYALQVASNPFLVDPARIIQRLKSQMEESEATLKRKQLQKKITFWESLSPVENEQSGKLVLLDELLESFIEQENQKVILWTFFVGNIDFFTKRYKQYNPVHYYGKTTTAQREVHVDKFLNDPKTKLFIANPQAAGVGLTLTSASICIFYDRNFSAVDFKQAVDRIHRIGQTKTCNIITLQSQNTIDQYVENMIKYKTQLAGYLQQDNLKDPNEIPSKEDSNNQTISGRTNITLDHLASMLNVATT